MTTPRRQIIRPTVPPTSDLKVQRIHSQLEKNRREFARWLTRLKRAFTFVMHSQRRIQRLERQLFQMENTHGSHH